MTDRYTVIMITIMKITTIRMMIIKIMMTINATITASNFFFYP